MSELDVLNGAVYSSGEYIYTSSSGGLYTGDSAEDKDEPRTWAKRDSEEDFDPRERFKFRKQKG
ncbi:MAG: hypothetical protein AB7F64_06080 [Gammaproteobacteria bacterium]